MYSIPIPFLLGIYINYYYRPVYVEQATMFYPLQKKFLIYII